MSPTTSISGDTNDDGIGTCVCPRFQRCRASSRSYLTVNYGQFGLDQIHRLLIVVCNRGCVCYYNAVNVYAKAFLRIFSGCIPWHPLGSRSRERKRTKRNGGLAQITQMEQFGPGPRIEHTPRIMSQGRGVQARQRAFCSYIREACETERLCMS